MMWCSYAGHQALHQLSWRLSDSWDGHLRCNAGRTFSDCAEPINSMGWRHSCANADLHLPGAEQTICAREVREPAASDKAGRLSLLCISAAVQSGRADVLLWPGCVHGGVPVGRGRQGQALLNAQRPHHDPPAPWRRQRPGCGHRDPGEPLQATKLPL